GFAQCDRHDAVLEGQGREVDGVVLEPDAFYSQRGGQAVGANERRTAYLRSDGGRAIDGQQLSEAPHRLRPRFDLCAIQRRPDGVVIVIDLQRHKVLGAEVERLLGIELATQTTLQPAYETWHGSGFLFLGSLSAALFGERETQACFSGWVLSRGCR